MTLSDLVYGIGLVTWVLGTVQVYRALEAVEVDVRRSLQQGKGGQA